MKNFFVKAGTEIKSALPTFLKGIIVGLGAMAPGLSGSILLVLFGLYQKVVNTVSHIFKDFKRNLLFLIPLILGMGIGIIASAKIIDPLLTNFPLQTNFAFLGLVLGTLPALWLEVRKEGYKKHHYLFTALAFVLGSVFFYFSSKYGLFPEIADPSFIDSLLLGLAVACAYLIPGVDSAIILTAFGLYKLWVYAIDAFDFGVLLPAAIGLVIGGVIISLVFNKLLSKFYTGTYSIVFGLFIAVILDFIYNDCSGIGKNTETVFAFIFLVLGFAFSLAFSHIEKIVGYIKKKCNKAPEEENE